MGLLTKDEFVSLKRLLADSQALSLKDALRPASDHGLTWRVELSLGGKHHTFRVSDSVNQDDRRYHHVVEGIRKVAVTRGGVQPFRNTFMPSRTLGWINIVSMPPARVIIDGVETQLTTPIFAYELSAGTHDVRLVTKDGRYDRHYNVRIEGGVTTRLAVDLR